MDQGTRAALDCAAEEDRRAMRGQRGEELRFQAEERLRKRFHEADAAIAWRDWIPDAMVESHLGRTGRFAAGFEVSVMKARKNYIIHHLDAEIDRMLAEEDERIDE